jgi:hypothetical protein
MSELPPADYNGGTSGTTTTNGDTYNPFAAAADREGGGMVGPFLRFAKGKWKIGEEEVPLGREYLVMAQEIELGDVLFVDKKLAKQSFGLLRDGFTFADPKMLKPAGDWVQQYRIPLVDAESGEPVTWLASVSTSKGVKSAVGTLLRHYSKVSHTPLVPVIALGSGTYDHPTYGETPVPVLKHRRWHDTGVAPAPVLAPAKSSASQTADDMDDDIPF